MYREDKNLLKSIVTLTVPSLIEYALQTLVVYVDYIMVSRLGTEASAAVGLTEEVTYLIRGGVNAVGIGALAYVSYSIGAKRVDRVKSAVVQSFYLALVVGLVSCIVALAISPYLPSWLGAEESIRADASKYFAIVSVPFVLFSIDSTFGSVLKAAGDVKTPLYVNSFMNLLNVVLDYFLIYDSRTVTLFGKTFTVWRADMGVVGAGVATAIATVVGGILMVVGVYRNSLVSPRGVAPALDLETIREFVRVGVPVLLTRLTSSSGRVLFTGLVSRLGTVPFTAHTLAFTAESLVYMPCVGMMSAVATLSGNAKGEGDLKKLNRLTTLSSAMAGGAMLVMGAVLFVGARVIIGTLTRDAEVAAIGVRLLRIVSINEPIFAVSVVLESVFNGVGDTKSPFIASTVTQWLCRVLGTYTCIYVLGLGVESAWVCMVSDNIARCVLLLILYVYNNKSLVYNNSYNVNSERKSLS